MLQLHPGSQQYPTVGPSDFSEQEPPLRAFRRELLAQRERDAQNGQNVGSVERLISVVAGSALGFFGVGRRNWTGLAIASVGAAMAYRGATGHCPLYKTLGVSTAARNKQEEQGDTGVHVSASFLINKPSDVLYTFWRNFENLPQFMSHLEAVEVIDDRLSHWIAKAPKLYGGHVEWDAQITADEPNSLVAWRTLEGSDVDHQGSVRFAQALGDRGTKVTIELTYQPPAGRLGRWTAKFFGEEPKQQIREDLRNFKRLMETGEILTIEGQPTGSCIGLRRLVSA